MLSMLLEDVLVVMQRWGGGFVSSPNITSTDLQRQLMCGSRSLFGDVQLQVEIQSVSSWSPSGHKTASVKYSGDGTFLSTLRCWVVAKTRVCDECGVRFFVLLHTIGHLLSPRKFD